MAGSETKMPEPVSANSSTSADKMDIDTNLKAAEKPAVVQELATDKNDPTTEVSNTDDAPKQKSVSKRVQEAREHNNKRGDHHDHHDRRGRGGGFKYNNVSSDRAYKNNIKSDMTSQEESSDPVAIRKQVEFYFSDSNLLGDEFLYSKVEGPNNLPVPISVIHSFKRMRHFQPLSAVIAALKDSTTLDVVDNDACIKRKYPLPEEIKDKPMYEIQKTYENKSMARSVYAKGFGEEGPGTQFDIEAFFAEFGPTGSVRLRRTNDKTFKGSVFVEFDSEETAKKFLALDPKPQWKGKELLIKSKKQYCDEKLEDIEAGRIKAHPGEGYSNRRGSNRGGEDPRDWKTRREEDRANGYQDRNGQQKGGRGRGRGGRGGRGRDGDRRNGRDAPKVEKDERNVSVPTVRATTSPSRAPNSEDSTAKSANVGELSGAPSSTNQTEGTSSAMQAEPTPAPSAPAPSSNSKKRAREDDEDGDAPAAKKLELF